MRSLNIDSALGKLPPSAKAVASSLNLSLAPDDGMHETGHDDHYLGCGASALNVILSVQQLAGVGPPSGVLDFGAGAGRVTRWLRAAFPQAALSACDLRAEDMAFCQEQFQSKTWTSGIDIEALTAPDRYDLIWVGSVLTHLSAAQSCRLIDKLLGWTHPNGLLIMSTIGRIAAARRDLDSHAYIHQEGWDRIKNDYDAHGFGYADYEDQQGYGLSLIKLSWLGDVVEHLPDARLIVLSEGAWDGLHDIVAVQRTVQPIDSQLPKMSAEAVAERLAQRAETRKRQASVEASPFWRATQPIRSLVRLVGR